MGRQRWLRVQGRADTSEPSDGPTAWRQVAENACGSKRVTALRDR